MIFRKRERGSYRLRSLASWRLVKRRRPKRTHTNPKELLLPSLSSWKILGKLSRKKSKLLSLL
uniref:Uncharacterized protein n=1 Tax=Brassica oleracea TaxID=3712 RepID=A0A3P6C5I8_BRAOL|nr:unnamed protein product [Brassica oleracea]